MTNQFPMTNAKQVESRDSWSFWLGHSLVILVWSLVISPAVRADSIFGTGNLETPNVTIKGYTDDKLQYEVNGRTSDKPADKVTRIFVTTEAPLNAAEEAYATDKWNQAVDGYQKTIRTTTKQWVKDWSAMRLIKAANKSNRFDAAAAAYILILLKDPASAASAKPTMPDANSTFLSTAVTDVNSALKDPKLTVEQRRALLGFLIELQQARKDRAGEDAAYDQLTKLPGADVNDPNARRVLARRHLDSAGRLLAAKSYTQAINEIDSNSALFADPQNQIEALYLLAEARYGSATSGGSGADKSALKDVALSYMRVVALAANEKGRSHVVDSLMKTALILQQIGQNDEAARVYDQIVTQYPDDPLTPTARTNLSKLRPN